MNQYPYNGPYTSQNKPTGINTTSGLPTTSGLGSGQVYGTT